MAGGVTGVHRRVGGDGERAGDGVLGRCQLSSRGTVYTAAHRGAVWSPGHRPAAH